MRSISARRCRSHLMTRLWCSGSFFLVGLQFPVIPFVLEVLNTSRVRFHKLNPSCFTKIFVFVWVCKSQGVEVDLDVFVCTHRVHYQPRRVSVDGVTSVC